MFARGLTVAMTLGLVSLGCGGAEEESAAGGEESTAEAPLPPDLGTMSMTPRVVFETTKGRFVLELDREKAPKTVDNMVTLVENRFYDGLTFHRVVSDWIIQGGGFTPELRRSEE
ncbi:MAG TPA: peptidylprolyl isomerase, partial [Gemmatimonadota bacterium]|nr:peptidylprolyl isomerase [Gemmatimonadota bacterium]